MAARLRGTDHILRVLGAALLVSCGARAAQDASPDTAEQERLLTTMRAYSEEYVENLPNFICEQITYQYQAGKKATRWRKGDVLTSRLLFSDGREQRGLERVNDRPIRSGVRPWRTPLQTEGEFGILLANIFNSASDAAFTWKRWDLVRGKRVAVFDFSIDTAHSTMTLSLSDLAKAIVPYHGTVYGDAETGVIWRITNAANNLPNQIKTKSISTVIDYDQVMIGNQTYLLPVHASIWLVTDSGNVRNELEFRDYRKFETDSVIKFAAAGDPAQPAPTPKQ
jgi:hypothetical protein